MAKRDIDWQSVDWDKPNALLARELQCNVKTVVRWRQQVGVERKTRLPEYMRLALLEGRKRALAQGKYDAEYQRKRVKQSGVPHGRGEAISQSHLEYGESHPSARRHVLVAPDGELFCVDNIDHFVREHPEYFLAEDLEIRRRPNGKKYCRASSGLQSVSAGSKPVWKGWTKG